jgi:hypothetical protein
VLANFTTLISGSPALAAVLLTVVALAFVAGVVVAVVRLPQAAADHAERRRADADHI